MKKEKPVPVQLTFDDLLRMEQATSPDADGQCSIGFFTPTMPQMGAFDDAAPCRKPRAQARKTTTSMKGKQ